MIDPLYLSVRDNIQVGTSLNRRVVGVVRRRSLAILDQECAPFSTKIDTGIEILDIRQPDGGQSLDESDFRVIHKKERTRQTVRVRRNYFEYAIGS